MDDIFSILMAMAENGYTWQETIIMGLIIVGVTLSISVAVKGIVAMISQFLHTIDKAVEKIPVSSKTNS